MKKILGLSLGLLLGTATIAQSNDQIQNKKGVDIMPVSGEFAVGAGIGMSTFTGFIGDMFNNSTNNNLGSSIYRSNPLGGTMIFGKCMVSDNNAIRASFYNYGYDEMNKYKVFDDRANDPDSVVMDTYRENYSTSSVGVGYEFRRGKTRLRGIYGGDALISWSGGYSEHYTYGNQMSLSNMAPTTAWGQQGRRVLSDENGSSFGLGVRGFVGVEYFVAPKICIGTEFGWTLQWSQYGKSVLTEEYFDINYDNGTGAVVTEETISFGGRDFNSGIDNANGQVYVTFYF
ncbi:MAG: hypothetical protein ACWA41_05150 [Putridiphycobacter sp.]